MIETYKVGQVWAGKQITQIWIGQTIAKTRVEAKCMTCGHTRSYALRHLKEHHAKGVKTCIKCPRTGRIGRQGKIQREKVAIKPDHHLMAKIDPYWPPVADIRPRWRTM